MQFPNIVPELPCRSFRRDSGVYREEVRAFSEGIYHHHDCIMAIRLWELDNEIHTNRMPWAVSRARHGFANPRGCPGMGSPGTGTG